MASSTLSRKRKLSEELFPKVFECLAENGWLPPFWEDDHSNLRLVSRMAKTTIDKFEGPDFESIVKLLNHLNGFNRESGGCDYCSNNRSLFGDKKMCQTCIATKLGGDIHGVCECTKKHRFAPILWEKDPRLNKNFTNLPLREQAKRLLQFHRFCVSNFLQCFVLEDDDEEDDDLPQYDLTLVEPDGLMSVDMGDFGEQMKTHNRPIFNLIHNLLKIGISKNDLGFFEPMTTSPLSTFSPWRETFLYGLAADLDDPALSSFGEFHSVKSAVYKFLQVHRPSADEEIVVTYGDKEGEGLTVSQIKLIPRVLDLCIENSVDPWALHYLGPRLYFSIDIYRPALATLQQNYLTLNWMPCLGDPDTYQPLTSFEGYNPRMQHVRLFGLDMFDHNDEEEFQIPTRISLTTTTV